ncbi:hypothetical protein NESM_000821700 [Novymonas esmeraldas]|uniref:Uncharacterized protein n=1 Tax=Novymonas esmeraldas TaxID=1808958 RepID=A0AAW0EWB9_9TRYP
MGAATSKDRYTRAANTGILTLDKQNISSWSDLVKVLRKLDTLRTITLSHNPLRSAVPSTFTALPLWATLVSVDLSNNGLTCACALGSETPLAKHHADDAPALIAAPPVANAAHDATRRLPLESLNISGNALHMLPAHIALRFPRLRRLVCTDNTTPLAIPGSLAQCIGTSKSLEVVALQRSGLRQFTIADDAVMHPFPALRELLLDQNHLSGTVSLGFVKDTESPVMPALRRISLDEQQGSDPLRRVDVIIFAHCPGLTSLSLRGNRNEAELHDTLVQSDVYRSWQSRQRDVVDKKLHAGGMAELI